MVADNIVAPSRGQKATGESRLHVVAHVRTAAPAQRAHRRGERLVETRPLLTAQPADRGPRVDARAVEDLVAEQVPHARDHRLVEQPGLDRRPLAAHDRQHLVELLARQGERVGSELAEVGVDLESAESTRIVQNQLAPVVELETRRGPTRP